MPTGYYMKEPLMRNKRRLAMLGSANPMKNSCVRKKVSIKLSNRKLSEKTKEKMRIRMLGNKFTKGKFNAKGKHWKIKDTSKMGLRNNKNPNWKGGLSRGYQKGYKNDKKYIQWREAVFKRDNWTCQECGNSGLYIEPHHKQSWAGYPQLRYDINNGVTLCLKCHKKTDNYKGKKKCK